MVSLFELATLNEKIDVKYSFNKDDRRDEQIHLLVEYLEYGTEQYDNERMYYRVSNVSAQMLVILGGVESDDKEIKDDEYVVYKPEGSELTSAALIYIEGDVGAYVDCSDQEEYAVGNGSDDLCFGEDLVVVYMLDYLGNEV